MDVEQRELYLRVINNVMLFLGLMVIVSLLLEVGFYVAPDTLKTLHYFDYAVLIGFILHDFLKLALVRNKRTFLQYNWLNFTFFVFLFIFFLLYNPWWQFPLLSDSLREMPVREIAKIYILITQVYLLFATIFSTIKFGQKYAFARLKPLQILLGSFILIILIGAGLLMLPKATTGHHISFVDALFTSTSATCVTGLIVVDTGTFFTRFGQSVILLLIQLGGLGIMTMAAFFAVILGTRMSIRERVIMRDLLSDESMAKIGQTLWQVLGLTMFIEGVGVVAIYELLPQGSVPASDKLFFSIFHAISAFCNAGFSTLSTSLIGFSDHIMLVSTFGLLIILGGVGFPVLVNLVGHRFYGTTGPLGKKKLRVNTQTHIVVGVTIFLIVFGAIWIWISNYGLAGNGQFNIHTILASFFQSITARTAGFNTINIGTMTIPAIMGIIALMFIGASPGSTGGGVKTTTFFLSVQAIWTQLTGKPKTEYRHRTIPPQLLTRSMMLILAAAMLVFTSFTLLTFFEQQDPMKLFFETVSAFGTVGLSMGATPELSTTGRIIITITMYLGRVGPMAFIIALGRRQKKHNYEYPEESVMLG